MGCRNRDDVTIRLSGISQERAWFGAMDGKGLVSVWLGPDRDKGARGAAEFRSVWR